MVEIAQVLQAEKPAGSAQVVLFIPALDRDGQAIDQQYWPAVLASSVGQQCWVDEGLRAVGQAFGGGTAFPPGKGVWRDDERGGQLLFEATVMILSFANPADLTATICAASCGGWARQGDKAKWVS